MKRKHNTSKRLYFEIMVYRGQDPPSKKAYKHVMFRLFFSAWLQMAGLAMQTSSLPVRLRVARLSC